MMNTCISTFSSPLNRTVIFYSWIFSVRDTCIYTCSCMSNLHVQCTACTWKHFYYQLSLPRRSKKVSLSLFFLFSFFSFFSLMGWRLIQCYQNFLSPLRYALCIYSTSLPYHFLKQFSWKCLTCMYSIYIICTLSHCITCTCSYHELTIILYPCLHFFFYIYHPC